jgi:hypothetical protein
MIFPAQNLKRQWIGIDISPMPVRHGQTPARRLHLPESEPLWRARRGFVVRDPPWTVEKLRVIWRSGVSAERRHLKTSGNICGGLPRRRYEEGESSAGSLKIGATGFAGRTFIFRRAKFLAKADGASGPPP